MCSGFTVLSSESLSLSICLFCLFFLTSEFQPGKILILFHDVCKYMCVFLLSCLLEIVFCLAEMKLGMLNQKINVPFSQQINI